MSAWESSLNLASDSAAHSSSATVRPSAAPDNLRRTERRSFESWLDAGRGELGVLRAGGSED